MADIQFYLGSKPQAPERRPQNDFKVSAGVAPASIPGDNACFREIANAQVTGVLDLSHHGLTTVPPLLLRINGPSLERGRPITALRPLMRLNLHSNPIEELPPLLDLSEDLRVLDAGDCRLRGLPEDTPACELLEVLDLSANRLENISEDAFCTFHQLRRLLMAGNSRLRLCPALPCPLLSVLDLRGCALQELPRQFETVCGPNLQQLLLSNNNLSFIPPRLFARATSLSQLDLSANQLRSLPDLSQCTMLTEFLAARNPVTGLPALPASLTRLDVSNTLVKTLNGIEKLPQLAVLTVEDAPLASFPASTPGHPYFPALHTLSLAGAAVTVLPPELGTCQRLERVNLAGCPLRTLPRHVLGDTRKLLEHLRSRLPAPAPTPAAAPAAATAVCAALAAAIAPIHEAEMEDMPRMKLKRELDLSNLGLTSLPTEVLTNLPALASLLKLNLAGNKLTDAALQPLYTVTSSACLQELNLSGNPLTRLPPLGPALQHLTLAGTQVTDAAVTAPALTSLVLPGCRRLQSLRLACPRLAVLDAAHCGLRDWPQGLEAYPLAALNLENNKLSGKVPEWIYSKNLTELLLANNDLTFIDASIARMPIRHLSLTGNLIRNIPVRVVAQGTQAVMDYCARLLG